MTPTSVHSQFKEVISRLVRSSLSVSQQFPSIKEEGEYVTVGHLGGSVSSVALKNISYKDIYLEIERREAFHAKLIDGSMISMQYQFIVAEGTVKLRKHRLCFFPSPDLPSYDSYPMLYEADNLFLDIIKSNIVRFPMRFDYDPDNKVDVYHPASHLSLGQYENCRIPVTMPVSPAKFILFIVRNFYHSAYKSKKNIFDQRMPYITPVHTISNPEKNISYFSL
ncbi:DUF2290 domain-containing protein [Aeromonas caviae]|uniref:DUF2290 domain-containing protein n=1 Tax=Aeromonas caviae TaxID=648 RepID=UPI002B46EE8D|nr:DUF2290 domain-containing protein [Aeromonas caviae]